MGIISWIILGALSGWIASIIMKRNEQMGAVANIVVGIIGAIIGGWITTALHWSKVDGINLYSILVAVLGACIFLAIVNAIKGRR